MEWKLDRVRNITEDLVIKLLNTYKSLDGTKTNSCHLGKMLYDNCIVEYKDGIKSLPDEKYKKKWGSYVGVFTSNGLGYTEGNGDSLTFNITPIANQLLKKEITYNEYIITILSRIQFPKPNGSGSGYNIDDDYDKPFIKILKVLYILYKNNINEAWFDNYDIVEHMEKSMFNCNYIKLVNDILNDRKNENIVRTGIDSRDILINKCLDTKLIVKSQNRYYINCDCIDEIKKIIIENELDYFNCDKSMWNEYLGKRKEKNEII